MRTAFLVVVVRLCRGCTMVHVRQLICAALLLFWTAPALAQTAEELARQAQTAASAAQTAADSAAASARTVKTTSGEIATAASDARVTLGRIEFYGNILGAAGFVLSAVSLLAVFVGLAFGGVGIGFAPRIRDALSVLKDVRTQQQDIERHTFVLKNLAAQFDTALQTIEAEFSKQPSSHLAGDGTPVPPQSAYDDDALIVIGDRLNLRDDHQALSKAFVIVGRFWRRYNDFGRATERLRRAIELDPGSAPAHQNMARVLWNALAIERLDRSSAPTPYQLARATKALDHLEKAFTSLPPHRRESADLLLDFGSVYFVKDDWTHAIDYLERGATVSEKEAADHSHEPDWDVHYSLACAYARARNYVAASDLLKKLVTKTKRWDSEQAREVPVEYRAWVEREPDFHYMREDTDWRLRLVELGVLDATS